MKQRTYNNRARHRGIVWFDSLIGLAVIVALAASMAAAVSTHKKTSKVMSERRAVVRLLEVQADRLQRGLPLDHPRVIQTVVDERWVRLSCPTDRGEVELTIYLTGPVDGGRKEELP